jgi:hypothetical protein
MLRIAVPNKGSLAETAAEMLHEAGYAGRRDPRALTVSLTRRTTSSSSTFVRATSRRMSVPARSMSASPVATCCSTQARPLSRSPTSTSPGPPSVSRGQAETFARAQTTSPACGWPRATPDWSVTSSSEERCDRRARSAGWRRRVSREAGGCGCRRRRRIDRLDPARPGPGDLRSGDPRFGGRAHQRPE